MFVPFYRVYFLTSGPCAVSRAFFVLNIIYYIKGVAVSDYSITNDVIPSGWQLTNKASMANSVKKTFEMSSKMVIASPCVSMVALQLCVTYAIRSPVYRLR